jgi:coenzyme PQQ precursor peptide PqqA
VEKPAECLLPEGRLSHYFQLYRAVRALSDAPSDHVNKQPNNGQRKTIMAWTTPTLLEICIGLEINGYLPAEF